MQLQFEMIDVVCTQGTHQPQPWPAGTLRFDAMQGARAQLGAARDRPYGTKAVSSHEIRNPTTATGAPTATASDSTSDTPEPHPPASISAGDSPEVPVPTIFVGKVYCPIPAGSRTLTAEMVLLAKQLGLEPPIASPTPDQQQEVAQVARFTDALSAYNILQGTRVGGKVALLAERRLAEQMARGLLKLSPTLSALREEGGSGGGEAGVGRGGEGHRGQLLGGVRRALGSLLPVRPAWPGAAGKGGRQGRSQDVTSAPAGTSHPATVGGSPRGVGAAPMAQRAEQHDGEGPMGAQQGSSPEEVLGQSKDQPTQHAQQQQLTVHRPLHPLGALGHAGAAHAQLAIIPLRIALSLLRGMPRHFLLVTDENKGPGSSQLSLKALRKAQRAQRARQERRPAAAPPPEGSRGASESGKSLAGSGVDAPAASPPAPLPLTPDPHQQYSGTDGFHAVRVYTVRGFSVHQSAGEAGTVEFVPAFLSPGQLRRFWRGVQRVSGTAVMAQRRLMRAMMRMQLERAAARIAGGGGGMGVSGGLASGGSEGGEGEEHMDEPPEVQQFIQEIGQSMSPLDGLGAGGGPRGIARMAATVACGAVTAAAHCLAWAGDSADRLVMATPLGPRLLGIPGDLVVEEHALPQLLASFKAFNTQRAAAPSGCALSAPPGGAPPADLVGGEGQCAQQERHGSAEGEGEGGRQENAGRGVEAGATPAAGDMRGGGDAVDWQRVERSSSAEGISAGKAAAAAAADKTPGERVTAAAAPSDSAASAASSASATSALGAPSSAGASSAARGEIAEGCADPPAAEGSTGGAGSCAAPTNKQRGVNAEAGGGGGATRHPGSNESSQGAGETGSAARISGGTHQDESAAVGDESSEAERTPEAPPAPHHISPTPPLTGHGVMQEAAAGSLVHDPAAYRRHLAAAALWLAANGKLGLESQALLAAQLLPSLGSKVTLAQGLPVQVQEAMQQAQDEQDTNRIMLNHLLPTLEHNGFAEDFPPREHHSQSSGGRQLGASSSPLSDQGGVQSADAERGLVPGVSSHASPLLSLQITHGKDTLKSQHAEQQQAQLLGKGLILVGDLDLYRQWALPVPPRGQGSPPERRVVVGVDDGGKLLR